MINAFSAGIGNAEAANALIETRDGETLLTCGLIGSFEESMPRALSILKTFRINQAEEFEKEAFKKNLKKLHDYLSFGNKNVGIFRASPFFDNPEKDEAIREYVQEEGASYVYISDIAKDEENLAIGQFEHEGVQIHPGDKGMECLAQRYTEALRSVLNKM